MVIKYDCLDFYRSASPKDSLDLHTK